MGRRMTLYRQLELGARYHELHRKYKSRGEEITRLKNQCLIMENISKRKQNSLRSLERMKTAMALEMAAMREVPYFVISEKDAEELFEIEGNCCGEGLGSIPTAMLAFIRKRYPTLAEKYKWIPE